MTTQQSSPLLDAGRPNHHLYTLTSSGLRFCYRLCCANMVKKNCLFRQTWTSFENMLLTYINLMTTNIFWGKTLMGDSDKSFGPKKIKLINQDRFLSKPDGHAEFLEKCLPLIRTINQFWSRAYSTCKPSSCILSTNCSPWKPGFKPLCINPCPLYWCCPLSVTVQIQHKYFFSLL